MAAPGATTRILALDPGTRHMGVAVLEDGRLIYHGVETVGGGKTPSQRLKAGAWAVARMIRDFRPGLLALEETHFRGNRNAALLRLLIDEIRLLAEAEGLEVVGLAPSTVKKAVTGDGRAGKEDVAKAVVARYPELRAYLVRYPKWKRRHHSNMFDAVAVGMACMRSSEKER